MSEQLKLEYFANRRNRLFSQMQINSVLIIPSGAEVLRNGDAHYSFRQDSDFFYLTGFNEPESLVVLLKDEHASKYILFLRQRDPDKEQWDGIRAGLSGAKIQYGADEGYDIDQLNEKILDFIKNRGNLYYNLGGNQHFDALVAGWLNSVRSMQRKGITGPDNIINIHNILSEMRLIKDEYEQYLMQKVCDISASAHKKAMQVARSCVYEYELEANLLFESVKYGARSQAYNPIVGSGANTCILHYNDNNKLIDKNGLVLIDAGAEYENYASDITRTFPASGKFTKEQQAIYQLVLNAQLAAIEQIIPGNTWERAQEAIVKIITTGLVELGLINSNGVSIDQLIKAEVYKLFYMHNSGHWLGIDVHDVGSYKIDGKWRTLKPGMVLTVEPGIYIKEGIPGVDKKWWNIGVRIEDDVLVTDNGHIILSASAPKQVHEIETLMAV